MATAQLVQIVLVTDRGLLKPSLIAAWGALRHLSGAGVLHFWGDGLTDADWAAVKRVAAINPAVTLAPLALEGADLEGAKGPGDYISAASMGRLRIPEKLTGRVLYIDGDTQVVGDLTPLFALDMAGQPVGAVRDYVVAKWCARGLASPRNNAPRVAELQKLMGREDISDYFNSGVLLLDTDKIRAEPELCAAMGDVVRASACPWGDQDHLNNVFVGRVHLMNPAWNSSWGRTTEQRAHTRALHGSPEELAPLAARIEHFHGPKKPWKKPRRDLWSRRARAVWRYRREMAVFAKAFPDLVP